MLYFLMETALGGDLYTAYLKNALHGSLSRRSFGGWGLGGLGFPVWRKESVCLGFMMCLQMQVRRETLAFMPAKNTFTVLSGLSRKTLGNRRIG